MAVNEAFNRLLCAQSALAKALSRTKTTTIKNNNCSNTKTTAIQDPVVKRVHGLRAVNEAFNGLLVDEEDYKGLRSSIEHYDNFDQLLMAGNLQDHELIEFRRIAAFIYKRNLKWSKVRSMLAFLTRTNFPLSRFYLPSRPRVDQGVGVCCVRQGPVETWLLLSISPHLQASTRATSLRPRQVSFYPTGFIFLPGFVFQGVELRPFFIHSILVQRGVGPHTAAVLTGRQLTAGSGAVQKIHALSVFFLMQK